MNLRLTIAMLALASILIVLIKLDLAQAGCLPESDLCSRHTGRALFDGRAEPSNTVSNSDEQASGLTQVLGDNEENNAVRGSANSALSDLPLFNSFGMAPSLGPLLGGLDAIGTRYRIGQQLSGRN